MSEPSSLCPQCGRHRLPGAAFCAYCGAALQAQPPVEPRNIPVPDRARLSGKCAVIHSGEREIEIREIGPRVAQALGEPLPDVTRKIRSSKGFLATGLDPEQAISLAERLEQDLGMSALLVQEDQCVELPPLMRMRQSRVDAAGFRCEAYTWDRTEHVNATWDEVFLISGGRLEVQEAVDARDDPSARKTGVPGTVGSLVLQSRYEYMLDIVLRNPWRRLRLDQNTVAFSMTEMRMGPSAALGPIYRAAIGIERFAAGVPRNAGLSLLSAGASDAAWEALTFLNKKDFESYTCWLIQLVRYGLAIPS